MVRANTSCITRAENRAIAPRRKPCEQWLALIPNAHEGYISWEESESIRKPFPTMCLARTS